jgi:hypothetical protein
MQLTITGKQLAPGEASRRADGTIGWIDPGPAPARQPAER